MSKFATQRSTPFAPPKASYLQPSSMLQPSTLPSVGLRALPKCVSAPSFGLSGLSAFSGRSSLRPLASSSGALFRNMKFVLDFGDDSNTFTYKTKQPWRRKVVDNGGTVVASVSKYVFTFSYIFTFVSYCKFLLSV